MKRTLITCLLCLFALTSWAQHCVVAYSYVGDLQFKSWKVGSIMLPTTSYLMGYTKEDDSRSVTQANVTNGSFKVDVTSNADNTFCMSPDSVIKYVFKGKRKTYPITIIEQKTDHAGKYRQVTIEVPIEKIQFIVVAEPRSIIINLPSLKQ